MDTVNICGILDRYIDTVNGGPRGMRICEETPALQAGHFPAGNKLATPVCISTK